MKAPKSSSNSNSKKTQFVRHSSLVVSLLTQILFKPFSVFYFTRILYSWWLIYSRMIHFFKLNSLIFHSVLKNSSDKNSKNWNHSKFTVHNKLKTEADSNLFNDNDDDHQNDLDDSVSMHLLCRSLQ